MNKIPAQNDWDAINDFAYKFDGYLWAEVAGKDLGEVGNGFQRYFEKNGHLPDCSMSELRAALFFLHRAHRHGGTDIEDYPDEAAYANALLDAMRKKLVPRKQPQGSGEVYKRENFRELVLTWDNSHIGESHTIWLGPEGGRTVTFDHNRPDNITARPFTVSTEQLERLLNHLEKMDFMGLESIYVSSALDVTGHYISLEAGTLYHGVEYDHGLKDDPQKPDYPEGLFELEMIVGGIAGV